MSFEGASPPLNSSDDRTLRQRNRVRKKIQQRRPPEGYYPQPGRNPGRRRGGGGKTLDKVYQGIFVDIDSDMANDAA